MYIMTQYYGQQEHFQTSKVLILENFPRLFCVSRQIFKCTYSSAETWKCYQVKGGSIEPFSTPVATQFCSDQYINMGCVSHSCYKNKLSCITSHNYQLSISNLLSRQKEPIQRYLNSYTYSTLYQLRALMFKQVVLLDYLNTKLN